MNHFVSGVLSILAAGATATLGWTGYYLRNYTHPDLVEIDEEAELDPSVVITRRDKLKAQLQWKLREAKVPNERRMRIFIGNARNWRSYLVTNHPDAGIMNMLDIPEKILGPAIRHPDGLIYGIGRRGRHHHCIRYMSTIGRAGIGVVTDQGFVTTHGRYVNRYEGLRIAKAQNQLIRKTPPEYKLFSEDLW
jgi:hypothetical protein